VRIVEGRHRSREAREVVRVALRESVRRVFQASPQRRVLRALLRLHEPAERLIVRLLVAPELVEHPGTIPEVHVEATGGGARGVEPCQGVLVASLAVQASGLQYLIVVVFLVESNVEGRRRGRVALGARARRHLDRERRPKVRRGSARRGDASRGTRARECVRARRARATAPRRAGSPPLERNSRIVVRP